MPSNGLSLLGFLERDDALTHLRTACMPQQDDDATLEAEWMSARQLLGPPVAGAGDPDIQPIPQSHLAYVNQFAPLPWFAGNPALNGAGFAWVEIDKLLAYQFIVDTDRSAHHCASLSTPPTRDELFQLCLPVTWPQERWDAITTPQSLIVRSRNLNVHLKASGLFPASDDTAAGIIFGLSVPLVHVVRLRGRCYLHNGFHRVYGARMAGSTHVPCVFRDVADDATAGITPPGTFKIDLLESANPPTVGHFTQGRTPNVQLRAITRVLHISWSQYAMPTE